MPTLVPRTGCDEPESPPMGAPSPAEAEVVAAGLSACVAPPSKLEPGWMGRLGLTMLMSVRMDADGLPYRFDTGV